MAMKMPLMKFHSEELNPWNKTVRDLSEMTIPLNIVRNLRKIFTQNTSIIANCN